MDKEQIKEYLAEAIDAMDDWELEHIFPDESEPDLYMIAAELVGIKGEVKKLTGASLMLNNNIRHIADSFKAEETVPHNGTSEQNSDIKLLLNQIIDQNDLMNRTEESFNELPDLNYFTIEKFKRSFAAWHKGYEITIEKWKKLIKRTGLLKTGFSGQEFDPASHEAIAVTHNPQIGNNIIVETEVEGYIYKQNLIRQAKVIVNKH